MSRQAFYDQVTQTLFKGSLPAWQKDPLDAILDEWLRRARGLTECAYVMATAYHETGRFKYDEEIGQGAGHLYGEPIALSRSKTVAYYGRGWPQHTWLTNYAKLSVRATLSFGREMDFVNNPDAIKASDAVQAWAMWECMISGLWTGKNFADYTSVEGVVDYVEARRIVNATDKAELIAGYAEKFEVALKTVTRDEPSACPLANPACPLHKET